MSAIERYLIKAGASLISKPVAHKLSRAFLATQGTGWASPTSGVYSSGEYQFLKSYLNGIKSPTVFDVGANIGEYSLAIKKANKNSFIHCFEPSKKHIKKLKANLKTNKVLINPFGLSDEEKKEKLYKDQEITGLASLIKRDLNHLSINQNQYEFVDVIVGDDYLKSKKLDLLDLIKIDVEGWEMEVLKGFKESFGKKIIKACQFEFGHAHIEKRENFRDFYNFFMKYNYSLGIIKPNGKINYIDRYDEIYENYYCTNYIAFSKKIYL